MTSIFLGVPPGAAPPIPGYRFMGSYIKSFDIDSSPGNQFGAFRPGLFLEGNWKGVSHPLPVTSS